MIRIAQNLGRGPAASLSHRSRSAYTLIELLICVAIIAILVGGAMSLVTGPVLEQRSTDLQYTMESGADLFFSQVVADFHDASSATPGTEEVQLETPGRSVRYFVDAGRTLRRQQGAGASVGLVPSVSEFAVTRGGDGTSTVTLVASITRWEHTINVQRQFAVAVGQPWLGGRP